MVKKGVSDENDAELVTNLSRRVNFGTCPWHKPSLTLLDIFLPFQTVDIPPISPGNLFLDLGCTAQAADRHQEGDVVRNA